MISFEHVTKRYNTADNILHDISFTVKKGEIVSIIGASGAGKTTLIRCINRLVSCTAGSISVDGCNITAISAPALKAIRRKIGMIFQNYNVAERLTVLENVLHGCLGAMPFYRSITGWYSTEEKKQALQILEHIGLLSYAYQRCSDLSGGQKQRVGIARALMQQPDILLCDEPVSALDPQTSKDILNYLKQVIRRRQLTCIMNMHQIEYAKQYSDRIVGLKNGAIVFDGAPADLSHEMLAHIFSSSTENTIAGGML